MTAFQWLFGGLMGGLILLEIVLQMTGRTRRIISGLRATVWLLALFLILVPAVTNRVAEWLSIGRGADVILYLTVISFLLSFFYLLHAVELQREQITLLVRSIALQQPFATPDRVSGIQNRDCPQGVPALPELGRSEAGPPCPQG